MKKLVFIVVILALFLGIFYSSKDISLSIVGTWTQTEKGGNTYVKHSTFNPDNKTDVVGLEYNLLGRCRTISDRESLEKHQTTSEFQSCSIKKENGKISFINGITVNEITKIDQSTIMVKRVGITELTPSN